MEKKIEKERSLEGKERKRRREGRVQASLNSFTGPRILSPDPQTPYIIILPTTQSILGQIKQLHYQVIAM